MLFFFTIFSISWSEEALVIGTEIAFRNAGDVSTKLVKQVLRLINEEVDYLSYSGAWLAYIEHEPYNTDCFRHWRFQQRPIGIEKSSHSNIDDLNSTLFSLVPGLNESIINGPWPFHFAFKTMMALMLESFSPLHSSEYFDSDQFIDGDDSGSKFFIMYNGRNMSLLDFWDTGCGRWDMKVPYTKDQYAIIKNEINAIVKEHGVGTFTNVTADYQKAMNESYDIAKNVVYQNIVPNTELSAEYVQKCMDVTSERIALAGYSLAKLLTTIHAPFPPLTGRPPFSVREGIAWGLMILLVPIAIYIVHSYLSIKFKFD